MKRRPWINYVPVGIQLNGGWFLMGLLFVMSGFAYLIRFTESTTITRVLDPIGLQVWGGVLLSGGLLLCYSIARSKLALEKLALNFLSVALLVYGGWIASAVPFARTGITLILIVSFVLIIQVRVAVIRKLLNSHLWRASIDD